MGMVLQLPFCTPHFGYVLRLMNAKKVETDILLFLVDLRKVDEMSFEFQLGTPFRPYEQLMGVLPVASMEHIPLAYQVSLVSPESYLCLSVSLSPLFLFR